MIRLIFSVSKQLGANRLWFISTLASINIPRAACLPKLRRANAKSQKSSFRQHPFGHNPHWHASAPKPSKPSVAAPGEQFLPSPLFAVRKGGRGGGSETTAGGSYLCVRPATIAFGAQGVSNTTLSQRSHALREA